MTIEQMYEYQKQNFHRIFNRISIDPDKERFIKRMSKYSGIDQNTIFYLPGIYDYDPVLLKTCQDIKNSLSNMINYEDQIPENYFGISRRVIEEKFGKDVISSITSTSKPLKAKDISRLDNVMSSSMPGTLGNPQKLNIKLAPEVKDFFCCQLSLMKDVFMKEGGIKPNEYIHKRKDSSCGAFFGSNSHVFFQSLVNNFITRCIENPIALQDDLRSLTKLLTQPLTRRMPKSMKPYEDYDTSMQKKVFSRELDLDLVVKIKDLAHKYDLDIKDDFFATLGGPKHRFVNNVSEVERMAQIINAAVIANHKSRMNTAFIFNEDGINNIFKAMSNFNSSIGPSMQKNSEYIGYMYSCLAMDVSGFDKSTNEEMMQAMSMHLDSFGNHQINQIIRSKGDLFFPHDGELVSFTDFANKMNGTNEVTMIGLNSGLTWVTFAGKTANTIMSFFLVIQTLKKMVKDNNILKNISVVNYCDGTLLIKKEHLKEEFSGHDLLVFCFNTGDDMIVNSNIFFLKEFIDTYNYYIKKSEQEGVMYAYKQEFDNEYLSKFVMYDDKSRQLFLGPNIVRRIASLLKPEHSVLREGKEQPDINWKQIIDEEIEAKGLYRNLPIAYISRIEDFGNFDYLLVMINNHFKDNFGYTLKELVDILASKVMISDDVNEEIYEKLELSTAEKLLIDNPEIAYYKVDLRTINPDLINQLFVNVTPEEYIPVLEKLGYKLNLNADVTTSIIQDLNEEKHRWSELERRINES